MAALARLKNEFTEISKEFNEDRAELTTCLLWWSFFFFLSLCSCLSNLVSLIKWRSHCLIYTLKYCRFASLFCCNLVGFVVRRLICMFSVVDLFLHAEQTVKCVPEKKLAQVLRPEVLLLTVPRRYLYLCCG